MSAVTSGSHTRSPFSGTKAAYRDGWGCQGFPAYQGLVIIAGEVNGSRKNTLIFVQIASTIYRMLTYDENKRLANLAKHGFDFIGAEVIFADFTVCREDRRDAYGEMRYQSIGMWNGVVVFVVHTPRLDSDHIISIRKAEKHEERIFWNNYPG
jgi:uncharacterized DUF497 family protein